MAKKLIAEQVDKFKKCLAEGYDVSVMDLTSLSKKDKKEYFYWKAWWNTALAAENNGKRDTMANGGDCIADDKCRYERFRQWRKTV